MAKIAFILLCHKDPASIIAQAEMLTAVGDCVCIHFDARAKSADYQKIRSALNENPNVTFARKRVKCGWGEWSLIKATLSAVEAAVDSFPHASHFYMLSGDCTAIKSARFIHDFLDRDDKDYIESFDFFESSWIKTGIKKERLIYRHFFNERKYKTAFYTSIKVQEKVGLARSIPSDIRVQIGSQWWCLRRSTVEATLAFTKSRKDVMRFFSTTWIPDETFFQTIVRHLVPDDEIETRTLTYLMFTDYGMPATFYNDHYDLLLGQNYLFARKISPEALELKERLAKLYADDEAEFQISGEGPRLFRFLTGRGRIGRRFASRFWEAESTLGRDRELLIVLCKKWHVAKRLVSRIRDHAKLPVLEYLFDEADSNLPDLGGIEKNLSKRARHRRALMRMLFDYYDTNRMVICLDPVHIELLNDFCGDRSITRLLEVRCDFSDEYLRGHAKRVGLASDQTPEHSLEALLPAVRRDINFESDRIQDADFEHLAVLRQSHETKYQATQLMRFLDVSEDVALEILNEKHLFSD